MHTTRTPSPNTNTLSLKVNRATECSPCASDLRSYEIDYDDVSECTETLPESYKNVRTAKGNEVSPTKMPLMRIRSVEIVFEDDLSTYTDTGLLDRSLDMVLSDSDDSTKCVDDLEHLQAERDDSDESVTLNADAEFLDDISTKMIALDRVEIKIEIIDEVPMDSLTVTEDISLNVSEIGDSGRFTEDACSSRVELSMPLFEDASLSNLFDAVNTDDEVELCNVSAKEQTRLYEYVESNSECSDDTAIIEDRETSVKYLNPQVTVPNDEQDLYESYDLQYDSFVDLGKF